MRAVHIITSLEIGGAQAALYRLATADGPATNVVVSLMRQGEFGSKLAEAGIEVHSLEMRRGSVSPTALLKLVRLLRDQRPDVVQTWMYHADLVGGVAARAARIRNICWGVRNTTLDPISSSSGTIRLRRLCAILSRWIPRHIVTPSHKAAELHSVLGYAPEKFRIIPNGYDLTQFSPNQGAGKRLRQVWGIADNELLLGMIARFSPQKNHAGLLAALYLLRKSGRVFRCVLTGSGATGQNTSLRDMIASHGLQDVVTLLGPRDDIPAIMNSLDVLVLSSSYGEAFPNVIAEAMACGTPCVATDVGDSATIVGETGWIVPPNDHRALADALDASFSARRHTDDWFKRKAACRTRIVERYDIQKMVASYLRVWNS